MDSLATNVEGRKPRLFDKAYLTLCDFVLDHSGWLSSIVAGAAVADSGNVAFPEGVREGVVVGGAFYGLLTPVIDHDFVTDRLEDNPNYPHNADIVGNPLSVYEGNQQLRNLVSALTSFYVVQTCKDPSPEGVLYSLALTALSAICFLKARYSRNELREIVGYNPTKR